MFLASVFVREPGSVRMTIDRGGPLLYLAYVGLAEVVTGYVSATWGVGLHASLLFALVVGAARSDPLASGRELYTAMALLPIARVLSLTIPLGLADVPIRLALINAPLIVATVVAAVVLGYSRKAIGLRIGFLPFQLLIATSAIPIAFVGWELSQPAPIETHAELGGLLWPVTSLALFTGFSEELLFRGVIQQAAVRSLGAGFGIGYGALLYGIMHAGLHSGQQVVYAVLVGAFFGFAAYRTRSLLGVVLAHTVTAVFLRMILPSQ